MTMMLRLLVVLLTLFGSQTIALGQIDTYCVATNKMPSNYESPAETSIQCGIVPGGEFGSVGSVPEVIFNKGF